ncbi:ribonuclease VapC51 [Longimycelium tulufanense]|uniref:Ribonuclease VapC n=1 Tax=Longimycelium tulufanense TaxID=907463 RepID=A0A8J3FXM0_9PSEU|nr:ribonuclease VapC51 [Longimycelium tulufanense]
MTHLADTSVLTRLGVAPVRAAVRELLTAGMLGRCAVTDLELGFSARNAAEWDHLMKSVRLIPPVEIKSEDFSRALGVQRALAEQGLRGRKVPALLIAAVAERHGAVLLHYDPDFELTAAMTGQPHEWVVPRGSIDQPQAAAGRGGHGRNDLVAGEPATRS